MRDFSDGLLDLAHVGTALGGIGIFLVGMSLMTDGLTSLGGRSLRQRLSRVTRSPLRSLTAGAGITALVQSSSVTTLAAVGFVSAGLLSFPRSLGIIFGANLGTTTTAWIVSLVGLKVETGAFALPLVGVGALVRLVSRGRRAALGLAVAGFGLVFVGIDVLRTGMIEIGPSLAPDPSMGADPIGRLLLVGIGIVMTVVMQSSSAAVATTLTALHTGTIDLLQAAALVIGQNVGTTVTAILAALGSSTAAKRAAAAHTMFNVLTGAVALVLLGPFLALVDRIAARAGDAPEVQIAAFHTAFNVVGVLLLLPLVQPFARFIMWLVPARGPQLTARLSSAALQVPAVALEAVRRTIADIAAEAMDASAAMVAALTSVKKPQGLLRAAAETVREPRRLIDDRDERVRAAARRIEIVQRSLDRTATYLRRVKTAPTHTEQHAEHVSILHALNHLQRLMRAASEDDHADAGRHRSLRSMTNTVTERLPWLARGLEDAEGAHRQVLEEQDDQSLGEATRAEAELRRRCRALEHRMDEAYQSDRAAILESTAAGKISPAAARELLECARWLHRLGTHAARAGLHLLPQDLHASAAPSGPPSIEDGS